MGSNKFFKRRSLFSGAAIAGAAAVLTAGPDRTYAAAGKKEPKKTDTVSAVEDLMREHGALNRILLIYEECRRRLNSKNINDFNPDILKKSATLVRDFIESYHEKLEEEFIFPRLEKAHKEEDLVRVLRTQHLAGRNLTTTIITLSAPPVMTNLGNQAELGTAIASYVRMYRPHEAREDTLIYPAFKELIAPREYDRLGDQFEQREHAQLGKQGFEGVIEQIAGLEKQLGIYELGKFTPEGA